MPRRKTAVSLVLSVRINPRASPLHARAFEAWQRAQARGVSAQAFLLQAIVRSAGYDPVALHDNDPLMRVLARIDDLPDVMRVVLQEALKGVVLSQHQDGRAARTTRAVDAGQDALVELDESARSFVDALSRRARRATLT
ncbi:MAG: hypothetical protein NZ571_16210 [Anaerolineae bacterium]|nr:hypothetical protein [Anaerolineae bacterium]